MNILELKRQIEDIVDNAKRRRINLGDMRVVIVTSEKKMGARACTDVDSISEGFDFEEGRVNILGCDPLAKGVGASEPIDMIDITPYGMETQVHVCSNCEWAVNKIDKFCRHCGKPFSGNSVVVRKSK